MQFGGDGLGDAADAGDRLDINLLGRELHRGISGVYAGELHVLGNCAHQNLALVRHGVEFNLFATLHKGGNHDGMVFGYLYGHFQELPQIFLAVADVHCGARKHIGRTHQHGEADFVHEFVHIVHRG